MRKLIAFAVALIMSLLIAAPVSAATAGGIVYNSSTSTYGIRIYSASSGYDSVYQGRWSNKYPTYVRDVDAFYVSSVCVAVDQFGRRYYTGWHWITNYTGLALVYKRR